MTKPVNAPDRRHAAAVLAGVGALAAASYLLPGLWQRWADDPADAVDLEAARAAHESGRALLVDVRERAEHAGGVVAGALRLPMSQLAQRAAELPRDPGRPLLLICQTQSRSRRALRWLREQGHAEARYVRGGMSEWARRGWPMVRPAPR